MNYGVRTPEFEGIDDRPLDEGIDYDAPTEKPMALQIYRSKSEISKRSLCSARGSYMELRSKSQHLHDITAPTVPEYEMPLHKIRGLRGLYQAALTQSDPVKKIAIQRFLKRESSVYKSRNESLIIRSGTRNSQEVQNKPFKNFFGSGIRREVTLPAIHLHTEITRKPIPKPPKIVIDACSPVPTLPQRAKTDSNLLRRPATRSVEPLGIKDPLFEKFTKTIDLKQKKFRCPTEQNTYYEDKYPLLLHAKPEEVVSPKRKKVISEEVIQAQQEEVQRRQKVRSRVSNLHAAVDDLERETEDIDFRTELRNNIFDPTTFPWNETRYSVEIISEEPKEPSEMSDTESEASSGSPTSSS